MTAVTTTERRGRRPVAARLEALARAMDGTRRRSGADVRQLLLAFGAAGMGLGFVAIVLGWYGASHSAYQFQEIPYLISGGLLGVALVVGGGFLFFAAWIVRLIEEHRRHAARLARSLEGVDRLVARLEAERAGGGPVAGSGGGPAVGS